MAIVLYFTCILCGIQGYLSIYGMYVTIVQILEMLGLNNNIIVFCDSLKVCYQLYSTFRLIN